MKKLLLLIGLAVAVTRVIAVSYTWNGGSSTWNTTTNWTPNGTPGTNDDVTINSASAITITLGNATVVNSLTVSGGSTISFAGAFTFQTKAGLTFSGGTKISLTSTSAFTLGDGTTTFSLTGNDASNYFTGTSGNGYLAINTPTNYTTNLYVDPAFTWYNLVIQKGTTVLKSNCTTNRLGLSSLNSQVFQLDNDITFTWNGTGSSSLGTNGSSAGYIDASASGSKIVFSGNGNAGASVFAGTNKIFAIGATVNHLEINISNGVFTPNTALKVNSLTLTTGNVNNTTNNITILNGGTIKRSHQGALLAAAPIFGLSSSDLVNIQYTTSCTAGNELYGTTGSIGTVTVNDGVTTTLSNSSVTSIALSNISGSNFTSPTVTISAPANGVQATATCFVTGSGATKTLLSVFISNPGYGYTSAPTVTISDATGSATGTPTIMSQTQTTTINALNIGSGTSGTVTYPNTSSKVQTLNVKDITVNTGGTFTCGTQTNNVTHLLNVSGNITKNGTFTTITTAGTKVVDVTMIGTTAQSINSAVTFNNLDISNTSNTVSTAGSITASTININAGSKLSLGAGLTVTNLNIKSNDTNGTATFIDNGNSLSITNTSVEQYLGTTRNWYVSSPVTGAVAPSGYTYYQRDVAGASWLSQPFVAGDTFVKGKGYIALPGTTGAKLTFSATGANHLNTGNVDVTLSAAGFNLIGNPYPSHLTWTQAFVDDVTNAAKIDPTIWVRTNAGSVNSGGDAAWSFLTYNAHSGEAVPSTSIITGGIIPPMQAFWVKALGAGTLTLDNKLTRSHQTSNPLKAPAVKNSNRQRLRLQLSNGAVTDETLIYLDANVSDAVDRNDSEKMFNSNTTTPEIFTLVGNEKLVINGLSLGQEKIIPLGINSSVAGNLSIKATEMKITDNNAQFFIRDKNTGNETLLNEGSIFEFNTSGAVSGLSNYEIIFRSPSITTSVIEKEFINTKIYYSTDNCIVIENAPNHSNIKVINAMGQTLFAKSNIENSFKLHQKFAKGVYLVQLETLNSSNTTKLIIN